MKMNQNLYMFRNEISPLYCDGSLNISSTHFDQAFIVPANKMLRLSLDKVRGYNIIAEFETVDNPYAF